MAEINKHSEPNAENNGVFLSIIIPCYNEEKNIIELASQIKQHCGEFDFEILFVDDGSTDDTLVEIEKLREGSNNIRYVSFLRNSGHQAALRAGFKKTRGKFIVTMDGDLQHPPEYIPEMINKAKEGADVVYLIREGAQTGLFKNFLSRAFYRFFNNIADFSIISHASDFRLVTRRVVDIINTLPERHLVLRTMLPYLGFKSAQMKFQIGKRFAGNHSYTFFKSLNLANDSIFNFTTFPLDIGFKLGWFISMLAFIYGLIAVYNRLFTDNHTPGYTDIVTSILFLGGLILIYVGVLGKYISIIIEQLKNRPEYLEKKKSD